jgi:hypothetical protein
MLRRDVSEYVLQFFADPLLTVIGITMIIESVVGGGPTTAWVIYTAIVAVCYLGANYVYESTDEQIDDIHDELLDD